MQSSFLSGSNVAEKSLILLASTYLYCCKKGEISDKHVYMNKTALCKTARKPANNHRTNEEDLKEYFSTFGPLADVYIPRPHRGFAFITFEKGDDAEVVLKVS